VPEHALHDRLAVIEGALDRERVHVVVRDCRHHAPLHIGDASLREQHEDVGALATAEGFYRGSSRIARGRDHDGGALAARREHVIHEPADELERHVLEGERRSMEELEQEFACSVLAQGRNRRVPEIAVGLTREAGEIVLRDPLADERAHHLDRDFGIGLPGKAGDGVSGETRPLLGYVEAPIAREAREHRVHKAERWGLAPGGDIAHGACASDQTMHRRSGIFFREPGEVNQALRRSSPERPARCRKHSRAPRLPQASVL
jgi:hypothetical protein